MEAKDFRSDVRVAAATSLANFKTSSSEHMSKVMLELQIPHYCEALVTAIGALASIANSNGPAVETAREALAKIETDFKEWG